MKELTSDLSSKRNITSAKAVELLAAQGITVTEEQAQSILDFMYTMARIELDCHLKDVKHDSNLNLF